MLLLRRVVQLERCFAGCRLIHGLKIVTYLHCISIPKQDQSNEPLTRIAGTSSINYRSKNQTLWLQNQLACIHKSLSRPYRGHTTDMKIKKQISDIESVHTEGKVLGKGISRRDHMLVLGTRVLVVRTKGLPLSPRMSLP